MRFRNIFASLFLVLALAACAVADTARVQDRFKFRGGVVAARDYANWKYQMVSSVAATSASTAIVPSGGGTVNTQVSNQSCFTTMGNGRYIQTVFAGVPILVIDGTSTETVTVTAVSLDSSSGQCTITATFGNAHGKGTFIQSGSFGLAEAVNDLALNASGGIVVTDPDWQGSTGQITGMSTSIGSTLVAIWDTRATGLVKYGWNGAAYAAIETDSATGVSNVQISIANEGGTGTTVNQLAKLTGAPSTAIKAGTGDDKNTAVIGIVTGGAGITGSAQIAAHGTVVACAYDATATTAGDFVTVSTSVAGKCHDAGATVPLDGSVVIGRVLATTAGSVNANTLTYSLMNNSLAQSKTGSGAAVLANSPTLVSPTLGAALATSVNGIGITTGTGTLTITGAKTVTFNSTSTWTGTDGQTYTAPTSTDTLVGRASTDTFTVGTKTFAAPSAGTGGQYLMATGGTAPTTVSQGGVYWEPTQNALVQGETSGEPVVIGGAFKVITNQTAITTVTTAQTLNSTPLTLQAGALNVAGKTLHVRGFGIFSNAVTTPTLAISLKIGSVVELIPTSAANANSNSNSPFQFDFYITDQVAGASGQDQAHGILQENVASAVAGAAMASYPDTNTSVSTAWDHTASQTVLLQATCGGAACTSITLLSATLEIIN